MGIWDKLKFSFGFGVPPEQVQTQVQEQEKIIKKNKYVDLVLSRLPNSVVMESLDDGLDGYSCRDEIRTLDGDAEITRVLRLPKVRSSVKRLTSEIFSTPLELIAASEDPKAKQIFNLNQLIMNEIQGNFENILKELVIVSLFYQNYFGEIIPKVQTMGEFSGKIIIDKIKSKRPGTLEFITDDYDNVIAIHSLINLDQYLPQSRFLIGAFDSMFSNPYGYTLYATLRRYIKAYNMVYQDMIVYSNRYSQPIAKVTYTSDELAVQAKKIADNLYAGANLALPTEIQTEFIQAAQQGNVPQLPILQYIEDQISLTIIGDSLDHGSYASDKVKADERTILVNDFKKQIQDLYFEQIIRRFTAYNFDINEYPMELYPSVKFALPELNKNDFVSQVNAGVSSQLIDPMSPKFREYYYKVMGYPYDQEEEQQTQELQTTQQQTDNTNNLTIEDMMKILQDQKQNNSVELFNYPFND